MPCHHQFGSSSHFTSSLGTTGHKLIAFIKGKEGLNKNKRHSLLQLQTI